MDRPNTINVVNEFVTLNNRKNICKIFNNNLKKNDILKISKLICIAHGWHLSLLDRCLVDESISALEYGPMLPSLQYKWYYKVWDIREYIYLVDSSGKIYLPRIEDQDSLNIIDNVWNRYKKFSGLQLSTLLNSENTPWYVTRNKPGWTKFGYSIDNELIKEYYKNKIIENDDG